MNWATIQVNHKAMSHGVLHIQVNVNHRDAEGVQELIKIAY